MMKILRDKILNPYSAIIYICLSVIMLSCKKLGEPVKHAKYIIINKTQHDITFKPEFSVNKLGANEVLERVLTTDADSYDEAPTDYFSFFGDNAAIKGLGLTFTITFDGDKCWRPTYEGDHSPLDIGSYVAEKLQKNNYKFTYTFTEADYNRAIICH